MKRLAWLLALVLSAVPALAQDKDKKEKDEKKVAAAPTAADLIAEAETKATAGDSDGAVEALRKATAMEGPAAADASLRLGKLLESRFEVDNAIDAYKAAAEKLTGAAKGEALGRLSVAEGLRGLGDAASASAEAAVAADAAGVVADHRSLAGTGPPGQGRRGDRPRGEGRGRRGAARPRSPPWASRRRRRAISPRRKPPIGRRSAPTRRAPARPWASRGCCARPAAPPRRCPYSPRSSPTPPGPSRPTRNRRA